MCPKGDDPLTPFQDYRTITIRTAAYINSGTFAGNFKFTFNGHSFAFPADPTQWTASDCEASFEGLSNVKAVSCSSPVTVGLVSTWTVQLLSFPLFPVENNIYHNDGNPDNSAFSCDAYSVTGVFAPSCTVTDVVTTNNPG